MLIRVLVFRVLPVVVALALAAAALVVTGRVSASAAGAERLPDLDQATPTDLVITRSGPRTRPPVYVLGFRSAVRNVGDGPLVIDGHRSRADAATMVADQLIERDGATQRVISGAGRLRYVVSPDHRHWHLLGFDRYELRQAGRRVAAVRDRKTGFCLGDRYRSSSALRAAPPNPRYTSRCGLQEPQLFGIREGISVGYGDDYKANLEGQYLPLTGLRSGRYVLVHRVNADRRLRELDYGNNGASLLLAVRWRHGQPMVRVLRTCPGTARCDRRPAR